MIQFDKVSKSFQSHNVINNVSFSIEKGETLVLLGKSGSGKTTILKMINRLIEPDSGTVYYNGRDVREIPAEHLRRDFGYVIQAIGLFPHMTVEQNISVVPQLLKWSRSKTEEQVKNLMERMGLPEAFACRYPYQLSGGQQQRVGIARALAGNPPLLLMDEPFGALDPIVRKEIRNDFLHLKLYNGLTKVIVTHDVKEAFALGDRIALVDNGQVIEINSPDQLIKSSNDLVSEFLSEDMFVLKLSQVSIKEMLPLLRFTEERTENAEVYSIEEKVLLKIFSKSASNATIQVTGKEGSLGFLKVTDLQAAFLKYDQQQQVQ